MNKTTDDLIEEHTTFQVEPCITYPSYKSMDEYLDIEQLKSLDGYVTRKLRERIERHTDAQFFTGPYKLDNSYPSLPGSRMVYLAYSELPDSYFDLDKSELWHLSEAANDFSLLMKFIDTLPFASTGRMLIMYDDKAREVTPHRDHIETDLCHDFIWFRTNLKKPFYMLNHVSGQKQYVETYSAWFDSVNQFHGSDGIDELTFSIRVDGHFTDDFRKKIPAPRYNLSSTPSFWAAQTSLESGYE